MGRVHRPGVPRAPAAVCHRRERQGTPQRRRQTAGQSARDRQPRLGRRPAGHRQARQPQICRREEGRVRPACPHRRHGCRRDRRRFPLPEPRPVRRRGRGSRPRRRDVPRLQPLARRLLQAVSRPPVRGRDAADAVGRARDRGDALRSRSARDARRLSAAEPVSRQQDDQRPDVRAVLDDGRGARLLDRLSRGLDHRDADRRRRPLRATARRAT